MWNWSFLVVIALSLLVLTATKIQGTPSLLVIFFAHIGIGWAVTGLVVEYFHFPMASVVKGKLPAVLALAIFGISDFIWGGTLFGHDSENLLVLLPIGGVGLFCIVHFGQRGRAQ